MRRQLGIGRGEKQGRPGKIRGPVQNFKMRVSKLIMYIDCNILGSNQIYQKYG
jgi:hypothetical protein